MNKIVFMRLQSPEVPAVYLFPAKENSQEFRVQYPKKIIDFNSIISFLKKNAEKKFKTPQEVVDYQESKKENGNGKASPSTSTSSSKSETKKKTEL